MYGLRRFSSPIVEVGAVGVVVAGVEHRVVGSAFSVSFRLWYSCSGLAAGQVDAAAAADEQRVAGDQVAVDQEALRARRVPGRVQELERSDRRPSCSSPPSVSTMSESDRPAMRCANVASLLCDVDLDRAACRAARPRPGSACPSCAPPRWSGWKWVTRPPTIFMSSRSASSTIASMSQAASIDDGFALLAVADQVDEVLHRADLELPEVEP